MLELVRVDQRRPQVGRTAALELDGVAGGALQQAVAAVEQLGHVDHARVQRLAPCEREQLAGQLRAAFDRIEHVVQALARGRTIGAQHQLHVGADDVQDIVEVVRHAAGQLAHRFELLRAVQRHARFDQARLALQFALFGGAARRDVAHEHGGAGAVRRRQQRHRQFDRHAPAARVQHLGFGRLARQRPHATFGKRVERVAEGRMAFGRQQFLGPTADGVFGFHAEDLRRLRIPVGHAPLAVERDKAVVGGFEDHAGTAAVGGDAVVRLAQFERHRVRQFQRAPARAGQQPDDQAGQRAKHDAGDGDHARAGGVERGFQRGAGTHPHGPDTARDHHPGGRGQARRRVRGDAGRLVQQRGRRAGVAIVDRDVEVGRAHAAHAAHQVIHAKRRVDPAGQGGAALRDVVGQAARAIHGQVHQHPGFGAAIVFLHQHHLAAQGRLAAVARCQQGRAARRFAGHVEAERAQVARIERLDVRDRCEQRARRRVTRRRLDTVIGKAVGAHLRLVRRYVARRQPGGDAQRTDAGEILHQVQALVILAEHGARQIDRATQEAARALQHLLVDEHAPADVVGHRAGAIIEGFAQLRLGTALRARPGRPGHQQRQHEHQQRHQQWRVAGGGRRR